MSNGITKTSAFHKPNWWKYIVGILLSILYLLPFYVIIMLSFKDITDTSMRLSFPEQFYLGNFAKVFADGGILTGIKNTGIVTVCVVAIEILFGCMAAYPLSRNKTKFNSVIHAVSLGVMMITPLSILVGVYSMLSSMGAISTYWGIVLVVSSFGLPTAIYMYTNFITSIPVALDEAAAIDGAGVLKTFFSIIFPQLKSVTLSVVIIQGVFCWNEFQYSLYILQKPKMYNITLTINNFFSSATSDYGTAAAAAVIGMLPVVVIYLLLQKQFIQGTIESAIK